MGQMEVYTHFCVRVAININKQHQCSKDRAQTIRLKRLRESNAKDSMTDTLIKYNNKNPCNIILLRNNYFMEPVQTILLKFAKVNKALT